MSGGREGDTVTLNGLSVWLSLKTAPHLQTSLMLQRNVKEVASTDAILRSDAEIWYGAAWTRRNYRLEEVSSDNSLLSRK